MSDDYPFIREIHAPLTEEQLRPLDPRCLRVQISEPLQDRDFERISEFMMDYPSITFRVYGCNGHPHNLNFLRHFSSLKKFCCDLLDLQNWDGLHYLPDDLEELNLGFTRKKLSLKAIGKFKSLETLYIDNHNKDFETISKLKQLCRLHLNSITQKDLSCLLPLERLTTLGVYLGGTNNLSNLPQIGKIQDLRLCMIRGVNDLEFVADLKGLKSLALSHLPHVTSLPSLASSTELTKVYLENLSSIKDLSPISEALKLERLYVINMKLLGVEDFKVFMAHPNLKEGIIALKNRKANAEIKKMLHLSQADIVFH